jgi:predicted ATPase/DNA-binding SARP family transcriptional activator
MPHELHVHLLGRLALFTFDEQGKPPRPVQKPPTAKSQSLLAYLILKRSRTLPREKLMGMLWGDRPERRARRSLSTSLWHIRRAFPGLDPVQGDASAIQFTFPGDIWVDSEALEASLSGSELQKLEAAQALYQGEFMEGYYDDWVIDERYRIQAIYVEGLSRLMQYYEALSRPADALATARRLLHENPLREEAHRTAMRALCNLGQRSAALEQYRLCREILRRNLDIEPAPESQQLFDAIQEGQVGVKALPTQPQPSQAILLGPKVTGQEPFSEVFSAPLVGREPELARLASAWEQTSSAGASLLLLAGEAGVGKTRLVQAFSEQVRISGGLVLYGHCFEFERLLPYQPFVEALRSLAARLSAQDWEQFPGWVAVMLSHLLPEIAELLPADLPGPESEQEPARLFEAIARFLLAFLGRSPILLVVEDLHWASDSTFELIHYLVQRLKNAGSTAHGILVAGTFRQGDLRPRHPLPSFIHQMRKQGIGEQMRLERLSQPAVAQWVENLSGLGQAAGPFSAWLYRETEGIPFFMIEIIKTLFETGSLRLESGSWQGDFERILSEALPMPDSVNEAISERATRLDVEAQEALDLAVVLGREFDFDLFLTAWDKGEDRTLEVLDSLLRSRLVVEGGAQGRDYAFSHHKIQEVIYQKLPRRKRQHLHSKVGAAMELTYPAALEEYAPELAYHFDQACRLDESLLPKALDCLQRAGDQALERFAHAEAVDYFTRAINLTPAQDAARRYDLLLRREKAFNMQGNRSSQALDLDTLETLAKSLGAREQAEAALHRASFATVTGDYKAAQQACYAALNFAADQAGSLQADAHQKWGMACYHAGNFDEAGEHFQTALSLAQTNHQLRIEGDSLLGFSFVAWKRAQYDQVIQFSQRARSIYQECGYRQGEGNVLLQLGIAARYQDQYQQAISYFEQCLQVWQALGNHRGEGYALGNLGVVSMDKAQYASARDYYERALQIWLEIDSPDGRNNVLGNLSAVSLLQGDIQSAGDFANQALQGYRRSNDRQGELVSLTLLGLAQIGQGMFEVAQSTLETALEASHILKDRRYEGLTQQALGRVFLNRHAYSKAQPFLSQAAEIFAQIGELANECSALVWMGRLFTQIGDFEAAAAYLRRAGEANRKIGAPHLEAGIQTNQALLSRLQGEPASALKLAQAALKTAQEIEALELEGRAWFETGCALEALAQPGEARDAFQQALASYDQTGQDFLRLESLAGLARLTLAQGSLKQARYFAGEVMKRLQQRGSDGAIEPLSLYLTCFQVLQSIGDPNARLWLEQAHALLQAQAAGMESQEARSVFLTRLTTHRNIIRLFATLPKP